MTASPTPTRSTPVAKDLYGLYDELDRLEELIEDMAALGVSSAAEAERRIDEINERIDEAEAEESAP